MTDDLHDVALEIGDRLETLEAALGRIDQRRLLQEVHSLKGLAAAYGLARFAALAHELEDVAIAHADAMVLMPYLDRMSAEIESLVTA